MSRRYLAAVIVCGMAAAAFAADPFELTGVPPGVKPLPIKLPGDFPAPARIEGQPVETRPPELATDTAAFPGQTRAPYHATAPYAVTTVADKLLSPWCLAFLPDGRILVTQRAGTLVIVDARGAISEPLKNLPPVRANGVGGLLDVALDRSFATNRRIFFSFSEELADDKTDIAIASATLDANAGALNGVKVIFRAAPVLPRTLAGNQGGKLVVAPDGSIFATIGDRSRSPPWEVAQRLDTHLGKIIHITADGAPAPGNPFIGKAGALPEIWSIGHRNALGLAFAPDGQLWEQENGPRGGDELNLIKPGKNYGWPLVTHGIDYPGGEIAGGATAKDGLEQPRYFWDPVIAPAGLAFYTGNLFPEWRGSAFVGALRGKLLDRVAVAGDKIVNEEPMLFDLESRVRDVKVGPDGAVYVVTDDGKLLKLTPK
ncbi:MAG: PQQ-dependent sugar dehydrogenase [Rhodospirillaceae bacterium]|nr:PQQ-dependent sugar dehydrogenase [Rhodospirillaceae bacterium]